VEFNISSVMNRINIEIIKVGSKCFLVIMEFVDDGGITLRKL